MEEKWGSELERVLGSGEERERERKRFGVLGKKKNKVGRHRKKESNKSRRGSCICVRVCE